MVPKQEADSKSQRHPIGDRIAIGVEGLIFLLDLGLLYGGVNNNFVPINPTNIGFPWAIPLGIGEFLVGGVLDGVLGADINRRYRRLKSTNSPTPPTN